MWFRLTQQWPNRARSVPSSVDGRSFGAAELFDAIYCRLFVHAYECLAQLAGDVEDFSAALVMVCTHPLAHPHNTLARTLAHTRTLTRARAHRRTHALAYTHMRAHAYAHEQAHAQK